MIPWIAGRHFELPWGCYNLSTSGLSTLWETFTGGWSVAFLQSIPYGAGRCVEKGGNVVLCYHCSIIQCLGQNGVISFYDVYRGFSSFFFSIKVLGEHRTSTPRKRWTPKSPYLKGPFLFKAHVVKLGCDVLDFRSVRRNSHSRRMREYPGLRTPEDGAWWLLVVC